MSTQRRSYAFGTPDPSQQTFPHISAPPGSSSSANGDEKQAGRLQQRTLGLTHRIWVLVCVVVFVILCTRVLAPGSDDNTHRTFTNVNLVPKNYLNASDDLSFAPFSFCPVYGPGDPVAEKYGAHALSKSKVYMGSGARVQRVIRKALSGQPVTMSVLGGSSMFLPNYYLLSCADSSRKSLHVMARVATPFLRTVTHPASSSGGTKSSPIRPQNSQTAQCVAPTRPTSLSATAITFPTRLTSWFSNSTRTIQSKCPCLA